MNAKIPMLNLKIICSISYEKKLGGDIKQEKYLFRKGGG